MMMFIMSALVIFCIPITLSYLTLLYVLSSDSYLVHLIISRLEEKLDNKEYYSNIVKVLIRFSILILEITHKILSFLSFLFSQPPPHTKTKSSSPHHTVHQRSQQSDEDLVIACIAKPQGFSNGRPITACIIYKCLTLWQSFQDQKTDIFDRIIQTIDQQIQTHEDDNNVLAYWLSNVCTLLVPVLQLQLEPEYPAVQNFKQQLTACVEKTYRILRDNLLKQIKSFIESYYQASRKRRSDDDHWQKLVANNECFLDLLNCNHVPPFLVRKIFTQIFSCLNVQLFNSFLLCREFCSLSNGENIEAGLSQLKQWCSKATEEYVGSAWDELKHTRQVTGFLVIQDKSKKTLNAISDDLCPLLNMQQLYKICTWFFDDKYCNRGVAPQVISTMKGLKENDYLNGDDHTTFLLDNDLSIPFSVDDLSKSMDQINITNIELPPLVLEHLGLDFLSSRVDS